MKAVAADPLLAWREEFPSLERTLHFISHSLGAMPRGARDRLERYAEVWSERGIRAWEEEWFDLPVRAGDRLGSILGAPAGCVSLHENVTTAQAIALSAIDARPPRNRIVSTAEDFPSVLYLYEGLERRGFELVRVPTRGDHQIDEADVVRAIDERTAVVAISHVLFRSSQIVDLEPIVRRAREVGARTVIDAYQSVGTVPVDVTRLPIDFLTGGSVKWLCGGPGASYLYASPEMRSSTAPAITGWMAHERPFDFDTGPIRRDPGARHFWTGTPGIPAFAVAEEGHSIVARVGVEAIRSKSLRQIERMIALADEYGLRVRSPREPGRRGGTIVLDVPSAEAVCRALLARDVLLDWRPDVGLRLAPHFYTRDDEVDRVMELVRDESRRR